MPKPELKADNISKENIIAMYQGYEAMGMSDKVDIATDIINDYKEMLDISSDQELYVVAHHVHQIVHDYVLSTYLPKMVL